MKTVFAATLAAAALFAGAVQASETTHDGAQVRATIAQPGNAGQTNGFGGVSIERGSVVTNGSAVADPARSANSGN